MISILDLLVTITPLMRRNSAANTTAGSFNSTFLVATIILSILSVLVFFSCIDQKADAMRHTLLHNHENSIKNYDKTAGISMICSIIGIFALIMTIKVSPVRHAAPEYRTEHTMIERVVKVYPKLPTRRYVKRDYYTKSLKHDAKIAHPLEEIASKQQAIRWYRHAHAKSRADLQAMHHKPKWYQYL